MQTDELDIEHDDDQTEVTPPPEGFRIDSEERVNWYLRKVGNLDAEIERVKAQTKKLLAQLEGQKKSLTERFEPEVADFTRRRLEEGKNRKKSIVFLQGTVGFRTIPASVKVDNHDPEAINEAQTRGYFTVDLKPYQKDAATAFKESGELLPGCIPTEAAERFYTTFAKPNSITLDGDE